MIPAAWHGNAYAFGGAFAEALLITLHPDSLIVPAGA